MSGFDPAWLALREPYDHAVRDPGLTRAFAAALGAAPRLLDLGCGSGSNLRFLAPHLPAGQRWICIDHDPHLLAVLARTRPLGIEVAARCLDLAADLDDLPWAPGTGVTAAALLDLASAAWLDRLAERCREAPVLMALSFDGRIAWNPEDPCDAAVTAAFCRHQRSDKGFGPALGPEAADHLAGRFESFGHAVRLADSDWVFGRQDGAILRAMVAGVAAAAGETDPSLPLAAWRARREQEIDAGALALTVGHLDMLALPP
jgi:SAM-dependent methyltransferase